jgi:hypothetical protein
MGMQRGTAVKLLTLLAILVVGEVPAATVPAERPAADLAAYVYLHVTRSESAPAATSCPGKIQAVRS